MHCMLGELAAIVPGLLFGLGRVFLLVLTIYPKKEFE
ncbi:hypothetical protein E5CHR_04010 [Variovorax sp. PBL-E5]|nr:hypothetical protein SRS16CHR_04067 [Variovorax sp. SRS16]VTU35241.1 hypothetical protein E5CHR_04010 [Variovorax sp. PBL-E5]